MTMLDYARPTVCPTWCQVDHSKQGAASQWHTQLLTSGIEATGLPGEPDVVDVSVEQFAEDLRMAACVRIDVDRHGSVAWLTPAEAMTLVEALQRAVAQARGR